MTGAPSAGGRERRAGRGVRRPRDDAGSATVWAALASGVILVVGLVGVDLASGVRARHVAESAADLSALAAAGYAVEGADTACRAARAVAGRSGAAVRGCRLDGWDALVEVEVDRPWTLLGAGPAGAHARAGPVPAVESARPPQQRPVAGPAVARRATHRRAGRAVRAGSSVTATAAHTDE